MEPKVKEAITKAGLWGKLVGKVSDGGSNLLKLWRSLRLMGGCEAIGLAESFSGACYTHALNDMTRDATNSWCAGHDPASSKKSDKTLPGIDLGFLINFN